MLRVSMAPRWFMTANAAFIFTRPSRFVFYALLTFDVELGQARVVHARLVCVGVRRG